MKPPTSDLGDISEGTKIMLARIETLNAEVLHLKAAAIVDGQRIAELQSQHESCIHNGTHAAKIERDELMGEIERLRTAIRAIAIECGHSSLLSGETSLAAIQEYADLSVTVIAERAASFEVLLEKNGALEARITTLRTALRDISRLAHNQSDHNLTDATGPRDAKFRGILFCAARDLANTALEATK